jgi:hypothetical protein
MVITKGKANMNIRNTAIQWLKENFPNEIHNTTRTSKYFPERELWFFTFPTSFFDKNGNEFLNLICEHESNKKEFHFIKIPFKFIKENRNNFDIRADGDQFDVHISARATEKFVEKRSRNKIDLKPYKQNLL